MEEFEYIYKKDNYFILFRRIYSDISCVNFFIYFIKKLIINNKNSINRKLQHQIISIK